MFHLDLISAIHIDAPPPAVRAVFDEVGCWQEWCSALVDVSLVNPICVGNELAYTIRMIGLPAPFHVTLTEVTGSCVVWSSWKGPILGTRTWRFEAKDNGTRVTDHKRFESRWLPVDLFYPRPIIRKMSEQWLSDLGAEVSRRRGAPPT
jgi:hypothetical protein